MINGLIVNSLMLRAAKSSMIIFVKSYRQKSSLKRKLKEGCNSEYFEQLFFKYFVKLLITPMPSLNLFYNLTTISSETGKHIWVNINVNIHLDL